MMGTLISPINKHSLLLAHLAFAYIINCSANIASHTVYGCATRHCATDVSRNLIKARLTHWSVYNRTFTHGYSSSSVVHIYILSRILLAIKQQPLMDGHRLWAHCTFFQPRCSVAMVTRTIHHLHVCLRMYVPNISKDLAAPLYINFYRPTIDYQKPSKDMRWSQ